jgi:hypothetical protein
MGRHETVRLPVGILELRTFEAEGRSGPSPASGTEVLSVGFRRREQTVIDGDDIAGS